MLDKIEYLIGTYYADMKGFVSMPPSAVFAFLARDVRYVPDPDGYELIMRPNILLGRMAGDCDDKAIAACSYFRCADVTTGYSLVSEDRGNRIITFFAYFTCGENSMTLTARIRRTGFWSRVRGRSARIE